MKNLVDLALNTASTRGATYADVRVVERRQQHINIKNGVVESLSETEDLGFGVRVIAEGAWGFASSATLEKAEVERVSALAVEIARAETTNQVRFRPLTGQSDK